MNKKSTIKIKSSKKQFKKQFEKPKQDSNNKKLTRTKKIKQKNIIYPLSTQNKIVFITNQYGVGFKKQKLEEFEFPSHIQVQSMLKQINQVCYNQWKIHHEKISSQPFEKIQIGLAVIFVVIIMLTIIYFTLISKAKFEGFQILNFIMVAIVFLILGIGIYVCFTRRQKDEALDTELILAIQQKLIQFNRKQQELFREQSRFKWTCHKDCLWIALNL